MMRSTSRRVALMLGVCALLVAGSASAQPVGIFRWQFEPYCNIVTLRAELKGSVFELVGTDDQCGAGALAAANGTAHVNPNGTAALALTVVRPDGLSISSSATLSLATISGPWRDEYGNRGTFAFNPTGPTSADSRHVTLTGFFAITFQPDITTTIATLGTDAISFSRPLPSAPAANPATNIVQPGGPPTSNCPGTLDEPKALPGQLCFYSSLSFNILAYSITGTASGASGQGDSLGALLTVASSQNNVPVAWVGRWAVTIP